jgi:hypothetical protein
MRLTSDRSLVAAWFLDEFDEDAVDGPRMDEGDKPTVRPRSGFRVHEFQAFGPQAPHFRPDVRNGEGEMVQPLPVALEEAGNHTVPRQGFQQLEADAPGPKKGDSHSLRRHLLDRFRLEPEGPIAD